MEMYYLWDLSMSYGTTFCQMSLMHAYSPEMGLRDSVHGWLTSYAIQLVRECFIAREILSSQFKWFYLASKMLGKINDMQKMIRTKLSTIQIVYIRHGM